MKMVVVALIAGCMMTSSAWAARLIEGTVTHDGTPILTVIHTANDSTPAAYLFRQVSGWQATEAGRKLLADGKQKVINGNITISLKHVDRVLVEATVKELELKARKEQASWDLTPGSVEKVAQAAGLEPVEKCKKCKSFCHRTILGEIGKGEEVVYSVCMLGCTENDDQAFGKMIRWEAGRILSKQLARSEEEGKKTDQLVLKRPVSVSLTKDSISQFRTAQVEADIVFIKDKGTAGWTLSEDSRKKLDAADWKSDPAPPPFSVPVKGGVKAWRGAGGGIP